MAYFHRLIMVGLLSFFCSPTFSQTCNPDEVLGVNDFYGYGRVCISGCLFDHLDSDDLGHVYGGTGFLCSSDDNGSGLDGSDPGGGSGGGGSGSGGGYDYDYWEDYYDDELDNCLDDYDFDRHEDEGYVLAQIYCTNRYLHNDEAALYDISSEEFKNNDSYIGNIENETINLTDNLGISEGGEWFVIYIDPRSARA